MSSIIKIDVAIPHFNSTFLEETVESVLKAKQKTEFNINLYIVDDCSTLPSALEYLETLENDIKVYYNESNLGLMKNFNRCIELSQGDFLHILHADDYVEPSFYEELHLQQTKNPSVDFFAFRSKVMVNDEVMQYSPYYNFEADKLYNNLIKNDFIAASSVVVKTEVYKKNLFNFKYEHNADYCNWLRITKQHKSFYINKALLVYRRHETNDSNRHSVFLKIKMDFELKEQMFKEGVIHSSKKKLSDSGLLDKAYWEIINSSSEKGKDFFKIIRYFIGKIAMLQLIIFLIKTTKTLIKF